MSAAMLRVVLSLPLAPLCFPATHLFIYTFVYGMNIVYLSSLGRLDLSLPMNRYSPAEELIKVRQDYLHVRAISAIDVVEINSSTIIAIHPSFSKSCIL